MTERRRRTRWSPARIRAAAWLAGTAAAIGSGVALAATPLPASGAEAPAGRRASAPPRRVIERHVIRRIVIVEAAPTTPVSAPTVVVQAPSTGTGAAPAPAPAPASTGTGGS